LGKKTLTHVAEMHDSSCTKESIYIIIPPHIRASFAKDNMQIRREATSQLITRLKFYYRVLEPLVLYSAAEKEICVAKTNE
jgi:hypothetical protein